MISKNLSPKTVAWLALALGVAACGDDSSGVTTVGSSTGDEDDDDGDTTTTSTSTTITTSGSSTTGPDTDTDPTDPDTDTTTTDPTDTTTTDPTTTGPDESGSSGSTGPGRTCGDDMIDGDDVCDGTDLGGADCASEGFVSGDLACAADCTALDTTACVAAECDGVAIKGAEVCDGALLDGEDCTTQGFPFGGTLACAANCAAFDTDGCAACDDGAVEGTETCDGADLNGQTCELQGFPGGGLLACAATCDAFDTTACLAGPACQDEDIGGPVGNNVAGAAGFAADDDDMMPFTCDGGFTRFGDHVMAYTAVNAGDYRFTTIGSVADTVLSVNTDCTTEIACNDDSGGTLDASVDVTLAMGQTVLVAVSAFTPNDGAWQLNVTELVDVDISVTAGPGLALAVPDNGYDGTTLPASMTCVDLVVADDGTNEVVSVDLDLGVGSTWVGDLVVKVVDPGGAVVVTPLSRPGFAELVDDGASTGPGTAGTNQDILFTDIINFVNGGVTDAEDMGLAGGNICGADGLCEYFPNPGAATPGDFSAFTGVDAVGTWQVCVGDQAGGDTTVYDFVSLNISKTP